MVIVSPTTGTLNDLICELRCSYLAGLDERTIITQWGSYHAEIHLQLQRIMLNNALSTLGMGNAFSGAVLILAGSVHRVVLSITKVQHKAFVAVDETGTEAAAATGVVIGAYCTVLTHTNS